MELKEIIKGFELFDSGDKVGHIEFSEMDGILKLHIQKFVKNILAKVLVEN